MVPQHSTVYFVFSQICISNLNRLRYLSRYHLNIKLSIHIKNMLTKFLENQRPLTYFFNLLSTHGSISSKVKYTISMFQCKTNLITDTVWITMLLCLFVEDDTFSIFPFYGLANKLTLNFNSQLHDSYLTK